MNATASVSRDAAADLTAVADFARPSKAWLTLTDVLTAGRSAHCCDFKICDFKGVVENNNSGFIEISNKLGIRDCDLDFEEIG